MQRPSPQRLAENRAALFLLLVSLALGLTGARPARANDHIFPAAPAARSAIDFDSRGFLIRGKRTFIVSAGMEYARVPRALWRDRLLRLKRAGFNCVEMYTFWNWHEPQEGRFNFTGDHDLDAYLKLVHRMGLYAIVRVGPYYCAEWNSGGYPLWLRFKPGLRVREDDPPFEQAVGGFFDRLIPIVAANQINHGGSVILVQLENEDPQGWGTEEPNDYFTFLQRKALALGLQVPYFFSGLHHGSDPAGDAPDLDDAARPNPWFTTEFWSVWYSQYGPRPQDATDYARRTWKIIAHGGNGYNYYMAHGGSDFGYTNDDEDAASYDYGAAVGQAGDLRPLYYAFKRCAWFARGFQDVLEDSNDASGRYQDDAMNGVRVTARTSPAGTIEFLDNPGGSPASVVVHAPAGGGTPGSVAVTLAPGEIMPVVRDAALVPGVTLRWVPTRVLGVVPQGDTTTLVLYGPAGSPAVLSLSVPPSVKVSLGAGWGASGVAEAMSLETTIPDGRPTTASLTFGAKRVLVLAMSDALADRTWFVDAGGRSDIVCGPSYVGDVGVEAGHLRLLTERPWQGATDLPTVVYTPSGPPLHLGPAPPPPAHPASPALAPWGMRDATLPARPQFDDHAWMASVQPLQMGADGDLTADAWYRTTVNVPTAGQYFLQADGARDRATVYLDGARVGGGGPGREVPLTLRAGRHSLAIFTASDGRSKLFGDLGPIVNSDPKGLAAPVSLQQGTRTTLSGWRTMKALGPGDVKAGPPAADAAGWRDYAVGQDAFGNQPGYAWFQTALPASAGTTRTFLRFGSVDDNGTVFVNGTQVASHQGWNAPFDVPVLAGPAAVLTVFVENTAGAGGLDAPVTFAVVTADAAFAEWRLRGGPGDPLAARGWQPLTAHLTFQGPTFFRTTFNAPPPPAVGAHPIWRVVSTGLGHGSVWVNGHNLGRYPEKIPINGLYIPECWLQPGQNSLVIYDEDGRRPDRVSVAAEAAASRDVTVLTTPRNGG